MRCFACDRPVSEKELDKKTDRYYCSKCFEPTNEIMLKQAVSEFERELFGYDVKSEDFEDQIDFPFNEDVRDLETEDLES